MAVSYAGDDGRGCLDAGRHAQCEVLHQTPPVEEAMAVHVMRAWMHGYIYGGSFEIGGQYLLGLLPDDANPY
jgi:hypothetical protein